MLTAAGEARGIYCAVQQNIDKNKPGASFKGLAPGFLSEIAAAGATALQHAVT
jgi:hypothetical protein